MNSKFVGLCIGLILSGLVGCGSSAASPSGVVERFLELALESDLDNKQVVSSLIALSAGKMKNKLENGTAVRKFKKLAKHISKGDGEIEIDDEEIDGNKATVILELSGKNKNGKEETGNLMVSLQQQNEQWLVTKFK